VTEHQRQAIVDIGSNSIRLVVFGGPPRAPVALFNEKLMAGLGRGVVAGGRLDPANVAIALKGLARFAAMLDLMQPIAVRAVATAAVRDAADGAEFLDRVRALGLPAELLDGDGEAVAAGYGVIAALPEADGLVADLGGGSLELVRVADGEVHERVSLPFGAMRVAAIRAGGTGRLRKALRKAAADHSWLGSCAGKPLYCVGGAWRTLARVQMHLSGWPLAVLGNYAFPAAAARELKLAVREMGPVALAALSGVSSARALQLDDAAALLAALTAQVAPGSVVISAFGLREGLLYQALTPAQRARDPLIDGVSA
jgi:exopolyphosphatase / guanosine-5'-triphosphate,3'-diphosphate pyrophosphatase